MVLASTMVIYALFTTTFILAANVLFFVTPSIAQYQTSYKSLAGTSVSNNMTQANVTAANMPSVNAPPPGTNVSR